MKNCIKELFRDKINTAHDITTDYDLDISKSEVECAISAEKNGKAAGLDGNHQGRIDFIPCYLICLT